MPAVIGIAWTVYGIVTAVRLYCSFHSFNGQLTTSPLEPLLFQRWIHTLLPTQTRIRTICNHCYHSGVDLGACDTGTCTHRYLPCILDCGLWYGHEKVLGRSRYYLLDDAYSADRLLWYVNQCVCVFLYQHTTYWYSVLWLDCILHLFPYPICLLLLRGIWRGPNTTATSEQCHAIYVILHCYLGLIVLVWIIRQAESSTTQTWSRLVGEAIDRKQ